MESKIIDCYGEYTRSDEDIEYFNNTYITEEKRLSMPTMQDIQETHDILRDFGINKKIPKFKKVSELLKWRTNEITKVL